MDIAKIGIAVEASGVDEAKSKLQQLAAAGRTTGGQLIYMASAGGSAAEGFDHAGKSGSALHGSLRPLHATVAALAGEVASLGPAGGAAATGFIGILSSITPVGLAAAALAATFGHLISVFKDYQEQQKVIEELDLEREANFLKLQHASAEFANQQRSTLAVLQAQDPEMEKINQQYQDQLLKIGALKDGTRQLEEQENAKLIRDRQAYQLNEQRFQQAGKEQQTIQQQIVGLQFEEAALGRTGSAAIALTTAQKIQALVMADLDGKHAVFTNQLIAETAQMGRLQAALGLINTGKQGIADFESRFGVKFDFNQDNAERQLAGNFVAVFNRLKDDPSAKGALQQAFSSLVGQLSDLGTKNEFGLLKSLGLSTDDIFALADSLKPLTTGLQEVTRDVTTFEQNAFGGSTAVTQSFTDLVPITRDLRAEFESSNQSLKDWGTGFADRATRVAQAEAEIGRNLEQIRSVTEQAEQNVARLIAGLDALNGKSVTIGINIDGNALWALNDLSRSITGQDIVPRVLD